MIIGFPPFYADTPSETCQKILKWDKYLSFPKRVKVSNEAVDLIRCLITDVDKRLGYNGAEEIKAHKFFKDIDWKNIKKMTPPFIPNLDSPHDTKYFDKFDEGEPFHYKNETIKDPNKQILKNKKDMCFIDFTYKKNSEDRPKLENAIEIMNSIKINFKEINDEIAKDYEEILNKKKMLELIPNNIKLNSKIEICPQEDFETENIKSKTPCYTNKFKEVNYDYKKKAEIKDEKLNIENNTVINSNLNQIYVKTKILSSRQPAVDNKLDKNQNEEDCSKKISSSCNKYENKENKSNNEINKTHNEILKPQAFIPINLKLVKKIPPSDSLKTDNNDKKIQIIKPNYINYVLNDQFKKKLFNLTPNHSSEKYSLNVKSCAQRSSITTNNNLNSGSKINSSKNEISDTNSKRIDEKNDSKDSKIDKESIKLNILEKEIQSQNSSENNNNNNILNHNQKICLSERNDKFLKYDTNNDNKMNNTENIKNCISNSSRSSKQKSDVTIVDENLIVTQSSLNNKNNSGSKNISKLVDEKKIIVNRLKSQLEEENKSIKPQNINTTNFVNNTSKINFIKASTQVNQLQSNFTEPYRKSNYVNSANPSPHHYNQNQNQSVINSYSNEKEGINIKSIKINKNDLSIISNIKSDETFNKSILNTEENMTNNNVKINSIKSITNTQKIPPSLKTFNSVTNINKQREEINNIENKENNFRVINTINPNLNNNNSITNQSNNKLTYSSKLNIPSNVNKIKNFSNKEIFSKEKQINSNSCSTNSNSLGKVNTNVNRNVNLNFNYGIKTTNNIIIGNKQINDMKSSHLSNSCNNSTVKYKENKNENMNFNSNSNSIEKNSNTNLKINYNYAQLKTKQSSTSNLGLQKTPTSTKNFNTTIGNASNNDQKTKLKPNLNYDYKLLRNSKAEINQDNTLGYNNFKVSYNLIDK